MTERGTPGQLACLPVLVCLLGLTATLCACAPEAESGATVAGTALLLRPDGPGADATPPAYGPADEVQVFDAEGGFFRVHYTTTGEHAVPGDDDDRDGVPDYVTLVGEEYQEVLAFFEDDLGFRAPLDDREVTDGNGGDGRFDVYLLNFPNSADGAFRADTCPPGTPTRCPGHMLQENDFDGRGYPSLAIATRILASHELFHAVQQAYHGQAGQVIGEGTAVWASEAYDPGLPDFEAFVGGFLQRPERSLGQEPTGPVDGFAYGSALFFKFLAERYGRDIVRQIWEALASETGDSQLRDAGPQDSPIAWLQALDAALAEHHDETLAAAYREFCEWNLFTGERADPGRAYQRGADYPEVSERSVPLPFVDERVRAFPLAARYYEARAGSEGEVCAAVRARLDTPLDGLHVLLARENRSGIVALERTRARGSAEPLRIATETGDRIHAVLVNTRLGGQSLRPDICLADCAEVAERCGEVDASIANEDAPQGDAAVDNLPTSRRSAGCSAAGPARTGHGIPVMILLLAGLASAARSRRSD